jgi:uncharacterized RDD family membrane protein YckC
MQFWLIEDGEKSGPFEDYEIREMIRIGKVSASRKIWHEGADGWIPAGEVSVLQSEFEKTQVEPPPVPDELKVKPPFLFWRRFGARWFDYLLYQLILLAVFRIGGLSILPDQDEVPSIGNVFLSMLPLVIMEGALIGSLGYTPGKWLMSLRVTDADGKLLSTGASIMRALRVWVLGMGMSHPILLPIAHLIALWMGFKKGAPLWDLPVGHRVEGKAVVPKRVVSFFVLLVGIFAVTTVLIWPEMKPHFEETYREALRQQESK